MIELKDYLHYYIGQEVYIFPTFTISDGWLSEKVKTHPSLQYKFAITVKNISSVLDDEYFPLLRRLSDITDEEKIEMFDAECSDVSRITTIKKKIKFVDEWLLSQRFGSTSFHYLLKQGFDLFGLIDAGLAIDKKTLNNYGILYRIQTRRRRRTY